MSLKKLEIFGFKSFADRVTIDFDKGITGIVGPNGSGKSNFSEAIKWVLGEQRPGELRSKSMQDVIFNGTVRRGSMSYCEIALIFDNTKKVFPMMDFDEVTITRKLYRSGDSEYLINKLPCLLKNIKEMILDTGLGKDGYSIIGQGRVHEIIMSKPEDRRNIFEEAAGISKYKKRKTEAEVKLKRTQEHLTRLDDIIREIERQLGPLQRQAEDAKKYNEFFSELKDLEVNHYLYAYDNHKEKKQEINNRLAGLREEEGKIQGDYRRLDQRHNQIMTEMNNSDIMISNLHRDQTELVVQEAKSSSEGKLFDERIKMFSQEKDKLDGNIERMSLELSQAESNQHECSQRILELEKSISIQKAKYDEQQSRYIHLTDEILASDTELENSSRAIMDAINQLSDIKADISQLTAEQKFLGEKLDETNYAIERIHKQIEIEENNRQQLTKKLSDAKSSRDKTYNQRTISRTKLAELKQEQMFLVDNLRQQSGSISSLDMKIKLITKIHDQFDNFNAPVQKLMQEAKTDRQIADRILGVVASLIKVPAQLEVAIETALGGALQNIVTQSENEVRYLIDVLKQKRMGRVTFLPITTFKTRDLSSEFASALREKGCLGVASKIIAYESKFNTIMSGLLGSTVVVDNYDNAVAIFKKYRSAFRIVTLEGEILTAQGSISGGSRKSDNSNILSQERELETAKSLYERTKIDYDKNNARLEEVQNLIETISDELKLLDDEFSLREIGYATESERESKSTEKLDGYLFELKELDEVKTKIESRREVLSIQLSSSDQLSGNVKTQQASVDDVKSKSKQLSEQKKSEKEDLSELMTHSRVILTELEGDYKSASEEFARYGSDCARLREALLEDRSILASTSAQIEKNKTLLTTLAMKSVDLDKLNEIKDKLAKAEQFKRDISAELSAINTEKDRINGDALIVSERRIKEENNLEKLDSVLEAMAIRLNEEYGLDHDGAIKLSRDDFDDNGAITQITNLKRSITKLGAINPGAIEQYQEEGARHILLTTERDDLVKASDDLHELIAELSKEMLERFTLEFSKISANFEVVFKEIFGGGKGELVIDKNAEDPLSAGVEIYAQPPGKKLGHITLFSGGEKALTAIAILFAIIKTKPMPFCVLDEIEAALDESNARLFAKYLKRFTNDTQFIVITHRKPTMEQSDRLYGVTMEERGVSKVVSVELGEAVKTASEPKKDA